MEGETWIKGEMWIKGETRMEGETRMDGETRMEEDVWIEGPLLRGVKGSLSTGRRGRNRSGDAGF